MAKSKPSPTPPIVPGASADIREVPLRSWRHVTFDRGVQVIQMLSLIIGIGIAGYQTVKLREAIDTSTWSALAAQMTEVDKQFIDNPEMVLYIYDNAPVSRGHADYTKAYAFAVLIIDLMDSAIVMGNHIDPSIFEPDAWEKYYEYQFQSSPIICEVILDEAAIYGKDIVARGRKYCPPVARAQSTGSAPQLRPSAPEQ